VIPHPPAATQEVLKGEGMASRGMTFKVASKFVILLKLKLDKHTNFQNKLLPNTFRTDGHLKLLMGRRGRRSKQLLNDLEETRIHWKLKEETSHRTL
jgi:hypothetical protein